MTFKKISFFFVFFILNCFKISSQINASKYAVIYSSNYKIALQILEKNKLLYEKIISDKACDTAIIISTIFPELLRYSLIQDLLETTILENLYLNMEIDAVDFSIGLCQIKPSFVKQLEEYAQSDSTIFKKYHTLFPDKQATEKQKRKIRLNNLKNFQTQIEYVCCFYDIVNKKFPQLQTLNKPEKIRFFATAYNIGFMNSYQVIIQMQYQQCFPYGCKFGNTYQHSYSDIAVDFFCHVYNKTLK